MDGAALAVAQPTMTHFFILYKLLLTTRVYSHTCWLIEQLSSNELCDDGHDVNLPVFLINAICLLLHWDPNILCIGETALLVVSSECPLS